MSKILSMMFLTFVSVALSIAVSIYGWGLQPKSWMWIVGIGFFGHVLIQVLIDVVKREDDK